MANHVGNLNQTKRIEPAVYNSGQITATTERVHVTSNGTDFVADELNLARKVDVTVFEEENGNGGEPEPVLSDDVSVASVAVDGVTATVDSQDATIYNVELPFETDLSELVAADVVVTATDTNAIVAEAQTIDNGETWTVLVTAEDTTTTATYTINVTAAAE